VRQRVDHKRTFYFLEQLILKHSAHTNCTNVKERADGLDFFYGHRSHATKLVDFLQSVAPIRFKSTEKLVSADLKNNTANLKHSFSVEIVPVCRDDLVCLSGKLAMSCGNISPLLLCTKVSSLMYFIDPRTLQQAEIGAAQFWAQPFRAICSAQRGLVEYTVLDCTPLGKTSGKYSLAEVILARSSDFGQNDRQFVASTHLGHLFKPGDIALGYDLSTAIFNDADIQALRSRRIDMPDVILVRKGYPERRRKSRQRPWHLHSLPKEADDDMKPVQIEKESADYERFLRDLEEDRELRAQVNLIKVPNAAEVVKSNREAQQADDDMVDSDELEVGLEELIDDLSLQDAM